MKLADFKTIEQILLKNGFSFKKSLGQNFIIDESVCPRMAQSVCDEETGVLEIGPGIGVLTSELAKRAKKVVAIELDERLKKVLPVTLGAFNNIEVIYADVMKLDLQEIIASRFKECKKVCICANLPYYITSPIIMHLIESKLAVESITVMVQKEAAERLSAKVGTRQAGAVTVAVNYYAQAEVLFNVSKNSFYPAPKVDSAVIKLKVRKRAPVEVKDEKQFFRLVKACFAQRRKTLINTVSNTAGIDKQTLKNALKAIGLDETVRGEQLDMNTLAALANELKG
ncbi:MAG: 16S rRNA (adenine(1518)-N(6)/adenine(1519)-N(6))-dimethyltransferase RsmA [Clostridia bacterium]|nr:16S rRNA (adenine(1518)-N(6)/adenine(1519)-N(6))-dimethyltransferase RsmA [Clostridia bacterium]